MLEFEVACIDVTSLRGCLPASTSDIKAEANDTSEADFVTVGLWTEISLYVLMLPTLEKISSDLLGGGGFIVASLVAAKYPVHNIERKIHTNGCDVLYLSMRNFL